MAEELSFYGDSKTPDQRLLEMYDHLMNFAEPEKVMPGAHLCWQIYTRRHPDKTKRVEASRYVKGNFGDGRSIRLEKCPPEDSRGWELTSVIPAAHDSWDSIVTCIIYNKDSSEAFVRKFRKDANGSSSNHETGDVRDVISFFALAEEAKQILPGRMSLERGVAPLTIGSARFTTGLLRRLLESLAPVPSP